MHELSIALSILDVAAEEAEARGIASVKAIHLKLGPLAGVVKEALVSAFEMAKHDSPLAQAELVIEEVPILIRCPPCQTLRPIVSMQQFACAECGAASADVAQGRELEIVALEIA
jgi:hydrogenase nickel incorporation protein HypA/HybF